MTQSIVMNTFVSILAVSLAALPAVQGASVTLESMPPVVVQTIPLAGATNVDPAMVDLRVKFSKPMREATWSWAPLSPDTFPPTNGAPHFLFDQHTCVLPVKLKPDTFYGVWINTEKAAGFVDRRGTAAVPYLLTFRTGKPAVPGAPRDLLLNAEQRRFRDWTEQQFRSLLEGRTFAGWPEAERTGLESQLTNTLHAPQSPEYHTAINSLIALHATNALPALRLIAFDRRENDCRGRWMAIRALGLLGDRTAVPDLIHLLYHGNSNTRWWAQISLVRLTGRNYGKDWEAWGKWWNDSKGQPPYKAEIIHWWHGQPAVADLAQSLAEGDQKLFDKISH